MCCREVTRSGIHVFSAVDFLNAQWIVASSHPRRYLTIKMLGLDLVVTFLHFFNFGFAGPQNSGSALQACGIEQNRLEAQARGERQSKELVRIFSFFSFIFFKRALHLDGASRQSGGSPQGRVRIRACGVSPGGVRLPRSAREALFGGPSG